MYDINLIDIFHPYLSRHEILTNSLNLLTYILYQSTPEKKMLGIDNDGTRISVVGDLRHGIR